MFLKGLWRTLYIKKEVLENVLKGKIENSNDFFESIYDTNLHNIYGMMVSIHMEMDFAQLNPIL